MAWRPSIDTRLQREVQSRLFEAIESIYNYAFPANSLGRSNEEAFRHYITTRKQDQARDLGALRSRLPAEFSGAKLGVAEIELLDFALRYQGQVLAIVGPRGAGKTSLLHYTEHVLKRCLHAKAPLILLVDALADERTVSQADLLNRLVREMNTCLAAAEAFVQPESIATEKHRVFQRLRELKKERAAVVAVDNLVHLDWRSVQLAAGFAREVALETSVTTLISLRPASLFGLQDMVRDAALIQYRLDVSAPSVDAWLDAMPERIRTAADELKAQPGAMSSAELESIFKRYVELLHSRGLADQESADQEPRQRPRRAARPIVALEAASADDVRHLTRLVKRILRHRTLPEAWLRGTAVDPPPESEFNILTAMMESNRTVYRRDSTVPNVLCFETGRGADQVLLVQRILLFLNTNEYRSTDHVRNLLRLLQYDEQTIDLCIEELQQSLLVRGSDREANELPSQLSLSEAGSLYLNDLLHSSDYVANAVMDVPLEHTSLHQEMSDGYYHKLRSIGEYAKLVITREQAQVNTFLARSEENLSEDDMAGVREIADTLSNGGLMSLALSNVLQQAAARAARSASHRIKTEIREAFIRQGSSLSSWARDVSLRLGTVASLGGGGAVTAKVVHQEGNDALHVRIVARPLGEKVSLDVRVTEIGVTSPHKVMAVLVSGTIAGRACRFSTLVKRTKVAQDEAGSVCLAGTLGQIPKGEFSGEALELGVLIIPCQSFGARIALLCSTQIGDEMSLRLHEWSAVDHRTYELGGRKNARKLAIWSAKELEQIGAATAEANDLAIQLSRVGVGLANRTLNQDGQTYLRSRAAGLSRLLIFGSLDLPWEYLRPQAQKGSSYRALVEVCETCRIPERSAFDSLLWEVAQGAEIGRIVSVGFLDNAQSLKTVQDLWDCAPTDGTLHIVGRFVDGYLTLSESLKVDAEYFMSQPLRARTVVISACIGGDSELEKNIPCEIACSSGVDVWASVTALRPSHASEVDRLLRSANAGAKKVDEFFAHGYEPSPVLRLYTRYAGMKAGATRAVWGAEHSDS